ncbi:unnamed protein product, partial [Symbiodinium pilosum]
AWQHGLQLLAEATELGCANAVSFAALASTVEPSGMQKTPGDSRLPALLSAARICGSSPLHKEEQDSEVAAQALVLLELLDGQGVLDGQFEASFVRKWVRPLWTQLAQLCLMVPKGRWRLEDPLLQRQTSLGPGPTNRALSRFTKVMGAESTSAAQLAARRAFPEGTPSQEPSSALLSAWSASFLYRAGEEVVSIRGRPSRYGDFGEGGGSLRSLIPVF